MGHDPPPPSFRPCYLCARPAAHLTFEDGKVICARCQKKLLKQAEKTPRVSKDEILKRFLL